MVGTAEVGTDVRRVRPSPGSPPLRELEPHRREYQAPDDEPRATLRHLETAEGRAPTSDGTSRTSPMTTRVRASHASRLVRRFRRPTVSNIPLDQQTPAVLSSRTSHRRTRCARLRPPRAFLARGATRSPRRRSTPVSETPPPRASRRRFSSPNKPAPSTSAAEASPSSPRARSTRTRTPTRKSNVWCTPRPSISTRPTARRTTRAGGKRKSSSPSSRPGTASHAFPHPSRSARFSSASICLATL